MGFFGDIFRGVAGAVQGFLGPAAAPVAAAPVRAVSTITPLPFPTPAPPAIPAIAAQARQAIRVGELRARGSLPHPGAIDPVAGVHVHMGGGRGGGNGLVARQTIVQTVDLVTGLIVRQEVFSGAPFLMASDVRKLRSIARKVAKANSKLPRRVVKESKMKQLTDSVVDDAIRNVGQPSCPPKC